MRYTPGHRPTFAVTALVAAALFLSGSIGGAASADYGGYRPHYQGYGVSTPGGRGGAILRVTNLNDSGAGSLRAALETSGPRYVIFETSGTIALASPIFVRHPYVTIAGQTAPSPGINIRNHSIIFDGAGMHDAVVQHIRIRVGDTHQVPHAFPSIGARNGASRIVFDHVSVGWTMYLGWGTYNSNGSAAAGSASDTAILDSILAFGLVTSQANAPGMGGAFASAGHTHARNLYVHNSHRQPLVQNIASHPPRASMFNNVIYGSGPGASSQAFTFTMFWMNSCGGGTSNDTNPAHSGHLAYVNNVVIPSTGTGSGATAGSSATQKPLFLNFSENNLTHQQSTLWLRGNISPHLSNGFKGPDEAGQWAGAFGATVCNSLGSQYAGVTDVNRLRTALAPAKEPAWHSQFQYATLPAADVPDHVFANAGARPLDRDPVDQAAVAQARAGLHADTKAMGSRIRSQNDMGGHPVLAQNKRPLQAPANPHAVAPGQSFRTNMELWLEDFARALEPRWQNAHASPPSPPLNVRLMQ